MRRFASSSDSGILFSSLSSPGWGSMGSVTASPASGIRAVTPRPSNEYSNSTPVASPSSRICRKASRSGVGTCSGGSDERDSRPSSSVSAFADTRPRTSMPPSSATPFSAWRKDKTAAPPSSASRSTSPTTSIRRRLVNSPEARCSPNSITPPRTVTRGSVPICVGAAPPPPRARGASRAIFTVASSTLWLIRSMGDSTSTSSSTTLPRSMAQGSVLARSRRTSKIVPPGPATPGARRTPPFRSIPPPSVIVTASAVTSPPLRLDRLDVTIQRVTNDCVSR